MKINMRIETETIKVDKQVFEGFTFTNEEYKFLKELSKECHTVCMHIVKDCKECPYRYSMACYLGDALDALLDNED